MQGWRAVKLRPSSHSDDVTVVVTYDDEATAEKAFKLLKALLEDVKRNPDLYENAIDWSPDEAWVSLQGKSVAFSAYTAGRVKCVEYTMKKVSKPASIRHYVNWQHLAIILEVPAGLTITSAIVILDDEEREAVRRLLKLCGEPKVRDQGDKRMFIWNYVGRWIFSKGKLYLDDFTFRIDGRENWRVEWLTKARGRDANRDAKAPPST